MPRQAARPRPTVVLFVRHGHTPTTGKILPGRAPGLHLSEAGESQARTVAERLTVLPKVAAIYASPLERTRETAGFIAKRRGLRVKTERGLLEADIGNWTGRELKAVRKEPEWKAVQRYPSGFRFPGGETFIDIQNRMATTVERIRAAHPGETVIAVSHADPIKAAVVQALGAHLDMFQRVSISPCSVTAVVYSDSGSTVLCVNSLGDLRALAPS